MLNDSREEEIINAAIENSIQYLLFEKATKENAYRAFLKYADTNLIKKIRNDRHPIDKK